MDWENNEQFSSWSPYDDAKVDQEPTDGTSMSIPYQVSSNGLFDEGDSLAYELGWNNGAQETSFVSPFESNDEDTQAEEENFSPVSLNEVPEHSPSTQRKNIETFQVQEVKPPEQPLISSAIPKQHTSSSQTDSSSLLSEQIESRPAFDIQVRNPEIQGEGVSSYVTYTIKTKTALDLYKEKEMAVKRRFSDFLWLQEQLITHHKGIIIPPVPEKDFLKTNKISGNRFGQQFLEYRRRELERFLIRVTAHPILQTSKYVQLFLETEDNSKFVSVKEDEKPKAGGFFSRISKAVSSVTGSAVEVDPWFEEKTEYIGKLHNQLVCLATAAQSVNQHHEASIAVHTPFMESMKAMGEIEQKSSADLSRSFTRVSEIIAQLELFEHELTQNSGRAFVDVLGDYVRLTESVQRVLEWRLTKLSDFQQAEKELERLESKNSSKLESQIETARQKIEETKEIFASSSELVKSEIERFEETKGEEIQFAIVEFVQFNMNREICMRDLWKKFMNDIQ